MAGVFSPKVAMAMLPAALLVPLVSSPLLGLTSAPACQLVYSAPIAIAPARSNQTDGTQAGNQTGAAISSITLERPDPSEDLPVADDASDVRANDARSFGVADVCVGVELSPLVQVDAKGNTLLTVTSQNSTSYPVQLTLRIRTTARASTSHTEHLRGVRVAPGESRVQVIKLRNPTAERTLEVGGFAGPA